MLYNSSIITGLEDIIHRERKVVVEVPDGCMIVFTSATFHVRIKSYERQSGAYLPHLYLIAYIVENTYVLIRDEVSKLLNMNKFNLTYPTCEVVPNENNHYEGHIIRYLNIQCNIDNLPTGKVLLGELVRFLKYDCIFTPNSNVKN